MTNTRKKRHLEPRPSADELVATVDAAWRSALTLRTPQRWCTYPRGAGDILGAIRGPNALGEHMVAVRVEKATGGGERVGWAYAVVDDFRRLGMAPSQGRRPAPPRLSDLPRLAMLIPRPRRHS